MGDLEHEYEIPTVPLTGKREQTKLVQSCFLRELSRAVHKFPSDLLHLSQYLCVAGYGGRRSLNSTFKMWPDEILYKVRIMLEVRATKDSFR